MRMCTGRSCMRVDAHMGSTATSTWTISTTAVQQDWDSHGTQPWYRRRDLQGAGRWLAIAKRPL